MSLYDKDNICTRVSLIFPTPVPRGLEKTRPTLADTRALAQSAPLVDVIRKVAPRSVGKIKETHGRIPTLSKPGWTPHNQHGGAPFDDVNGKRCMDGFFPCC